MKWIGRGMVRRCYRDHHRNTVYTYCVDTWLLGHRDGVASMLWTGKGGWRFDKGSHAEAFWRGFLGQPDDFRPLPGYALERKAARAAGIDCARYAREVWRRYVIETRPDAYSAEAL